MSLRANVGFSFVAIWSLAKVGYNKDASSTRPHLYLLPSLLHLKGLTITPINPHTYRSTPVHAGDAGETIFCGEVLCGRLSSHRVTLDKFTFRIWNESFVRVVSWCLSWALFRTFTFFYSKKRVWHHCLTIPTLSIRVWNTSPAIPAHTRFLL